MLHAPGTILFHFYEVLANIGQGGMGAVYKARDLRSNEIVAIKQMRPDLQSGFLPAEMKERFDKEWTALHALSHPRIPRMLASFSQGDSAYYVMEFIEGYSLDHLLKGYSEAGEHFPTVLILEYALQILEVLVYLHGLEKPLMHRDIKPQNIIVRLADNQVVLVDFGLVRTAGSASTKTMVGTLGYCPLEQVKGHPEPRSDLYALGATMYHMLSGEPPAPFDIPPLERVRPDVPKGIAEIVDRAVRSNPQQRYASAVRMEMAVRTQLAQLTGESDDRLAQLYMEQEPYTEYRAAGSHTMPTWVFFGSLTAGIAMVLVVLLGVSHLRTSWAEPERLGPVAAAPAVSFQPGSGQAPPVEVAPPKLAAPVTSIELKPASESQARLAAGFFPAPFKLKGIAGSLAIDGTLEAPAGGPAGLWFESSQRFVPGLLRFQLLRERGPASLQMQLVSGTHGTTLGLACNYEPAQHRYVTGMALMTAGQPTINADRALVSAEDSFGAFSWFTLRFNHSSIELEQDGLEGLSTIPLSLPSVDIVRILIVGEATRPQAIRLQNVSLVAR